jgi:hypothetical protein
VWNFGTDTLVARAAHWWGYTYHYYTVNRKQTDTHHQIILLTPVKRFHSPFFPIDHFIGGHRLATMSLVERLTIPADPNVKGSVAHTDKFLRLAIMAKGGKTISTGKPSTYLCANIPAIIDDGIASLARTSDKMQLTPCTIRTVYPEVSQGEGTILTEYHRFKLQKTADLVFPVEASVYRYQFDPLGFDPAAKPTLTPFMSPIALGCFAPDSCKGNDQAAINGRIIGVKPSADVVVTAEELRTMEEFLEHLIPSTMVGTGHPVGHSDVWDKQDRPAQRSILQRASLAVSNTVDKPIQSFVKKEAYGDIKDPRIISTLPGVNKNNYSRFLYAFTTVLRVTKWYAFGWSPLKIAKRVAEICLLAIIWVIKTDLSRFDGRVSVVLRKLEHMAMMRYFHTRYHPELAELLATQQNQRAYTTHGVQYDTGTSRASGSPETADFNSMDNAYMAFKTLRKTKRNGQYLTPREAWDALGVYGGDDGLTADVDPESYAVECASVGQVLEAEVVKRGELKVQFLAREYSREVWAGSPNSMCDVKRQLTKLHVTTAMHPGVTKLEKLGEKLFAFYLTDASTPIIGDFARMFVEFFPSLVPSRLGALRGVANYAAVHHTGEQYPNEDSGWMRTRVAEELPGFNFDEFDSWLSRRSWDTNNPELLLEPPVMWRSDAPLESKLAVSVNGTMVGPKYEPSSPALPVGTSAQKSKATYTPENLADMAQRPCKLHNTSAGCKFGHKCRYKHVD